MTRHRTLASSTVRLLRSGAEGKRTKERDGAFWVTQGGKKDNILRFVLFSGPEVMAYFSFFLKKKKVSVKEEGRQATLQTSLERGNLLPPARELIPTIDPCYRGQQEPCLPTPPPSPHHHPQVYVWSFVPQAGQHLLTLFNSTCSHWCYLTGIFQPFHFTSASYKARSEPAALQQLVKFIPLFAAATTSQTMY